MGKSTLKIDMYCSLVIQGFSNFLGLFQVIMANPDEYGLLYNPKDPYPSHPSRFDGPNPIPTIGL